MELILGLATILEVMVVGVLVMALWQDRRHDVAKRDQHLALGNLKLHPPLWIRSKNHPSKLPLVTHHFDCTALSRF